MARHAQMRPRRWAPAIISGAVFAAVGAVVGFSLSATGAVTGSPNETCTVHVSNGILDEQLACTPDSAAPSSSAPTTTAPPTSASPSTVPTTPPPTTPAPTMTESPTQLPPGDDFPDDTTTGPGSTVLKACTSTITKAGTYDGCSFNGPVTVSASNVIITNCKVNAPGANWGIGLAHANNVTVKNCDIGSPNLTGQNRLAVGVKDIYGDATGQQVIASNIHGAATGVQFNNGLIQDNYIHDMGFLSGDHVNGTTSNAGSSKQLVIRHNTVLDQLDQTDAVSLFEDFGAQRNAVIDDNLIGGGDYALYGGANTGGAKTSNIVITNNQVTTRFYKQGGQYGPASNFAASGSGNVWSGNTWADGPNAGKTIPAPQG